MLYMTKYDQYIAKMNHSTYGVCKSLHALCCDRERGRGDFPPSAMNLRYATFLYSYPFIVVIGKAQFIATIYAFKIVQAAQFLRHCVTCSRAVR